MVIVAKGVAVENAVHQMMYRMFDQGDRNAPGAAIGVLCKDDIFVNTYGLADLETGIPIETTTRFRLASLTKQFTAMAIMILSEAGECEYDNAISRFLPDFPAWAKQVTIRHLLNHTAGIEDYEDLFLQQNRVASDYPSNSELRQASADPTFDETMELLARATLRFSPGDEWEYSNSGYVVLARIIERITQSPFPQFLKRHVFSPSDMKDTFVSDVAVEKIDNQAKSYAREGDGFKQIDYTPFNRIYGPDGAYSTIVDMLNWCRVLNSEKLVNKATRDEGFRSANLNNGASAGYGFGWYTSIYCDSRRVSHSGSWCGFRSFIVYHPDERFAMVVVSNKAEFDDVSRSALAAALTRTYLPGSPFSARAKPRTLQDYEGGYESTLGEILTIIAERQHLRVDSEDGFPLLLRHESDVKFAVQDAEADSYFFHKDDGGKIRGVTRHLSLFGHSRDAYTVFTKR